MYPMVVAVAVTEPRALALAWNHPDDREVDMAAIGGNRQDRRGFPACDMATHKQLNPTPPCCDQGPSASTLYDPTTGR